MRIILLLLILSISCSVSQAQLLHPLDLVIGRWGVNLCRKDVHLLESMVFPPNVSSQSFDSDTDSNSNSHDTVLKPSNSKRRKRKFQCELFLDADGTFVLHPPTDFNTATFNGKAYHARHLPLKGRWNLRPNPYCVTDRQYDELTLISNPKIRYHEDKENVVDREEKITLEMHCKVWGRFGSNTIRSFLKRPRGRDAARLTHGTLCIRKDVIEKGHNSISPAVTQNTRRAVCATFSAKTNQRQ